MEAVKGQSDERGKIPTFTTIAIEQTKKKIDLCQQSGKNLYIADLSGKLTTYFEYSGHHWFGFGSLNKAVLMKKKSKEDVGEEFRKALVHCMVRGKHLVVNLDNTIPNFKRDYDHDKLPLSKLVLIPEELKKKFLQVVADDENYDASGTIQGCYEMHKDFMIIFYTNAGDPDFDDCMIQMALDSIPLVDTFERFYVDQGENIPGYMEAIAEQEA